MRKTGRKKEREVGKLVRETLSKHPEVMRTLPEGTMLHRVQPSKYDDNPINYKRDSDTRYADPNQQVGVYYLGGSEEVALAESFQPGQGVDDQAVAVAALERSSLHRLETERPLKLVDAGALASRALGRRLVDLVQAKGQGKEGYKLTRELSGACIEQGGEIDGLLYTSAVYAESGTLGGCNVVLFEGRGSQVKPIDYKPVVEAELSSRKTAVEFLESLGVVLE